MRYQMNCQFETSIAAGVTREQVEDAVEPVLTMLGEYLGDQENIDRSADVWFDGQSVVACVNAYVGYDFPEAFDETCAALGKLAGQPFMATLSNEDGNGPGPTLVETRYGPLAITSGP